MGFISWMSGIFGGSVPTKITAEEWAEVFSLVGETCFRELAYSAAKTMIGNCISKCEFKTIANGAETKGPEWYLWNVEPNQNENSSEFLRKIVYRLCDNNECLVVEQGGKLYVADSFARKPYTLLEDVFSQVTVGDLTFRRGFVQSEVLYWRLADRNIKKALEALNASYSKMIAYGMQAYQKSRGTKAVLSIDSFPQDVKKEEQSQWMTEQIKKYKTFLESDNAMVVQGTGLKLDAFNRSTTYSNEATRDIRAMIGDIFDFTALAFSIPPTLMRGDVQGTSDAVDNLLTFGIDSWACMLQEEIVRKRIGQAAHLRGMDLIVDTSQIKHIDVMSSAQNIEKLIGAGAFSINDILKMLGRPTIKEDWANQHWVTKNFAQIEDILKALTGGGEKK